MENPVLSLIVPMYRVEQYVEKCLSSIVKQLDGERVELIIVNDGSPDKSEEIAKKFVDADKRIYLISQENKGLSAARNTGLAHASGSYVWFIDSDDWIAENSIKIILGAINNYSPDAIHICTADVINDIPVKKYSLAPYIKMSMRGFEMMKQNVFHGVVQYTIYKKEILDKYNLRFYEGIYHEDMEFSPRAYYYLQDVRCIDEVLYLKRENFDSIIRTFNPKKNKDLLKVSESLKNFAETACNENDRSFYLRLAANALKLSMRNEIDLMSQEEKKELNQLLYSKPYLFDSFIGADIRYYKIVGYIHRIFPKHHIQVAKFIDTLIPKK